MASSILGAFEGVKTKKKNKEILVILKNLQKILLKTA